MDIGTAFLPGVLVGQWVLLFIIWRVLNKLVGLISDAGTYSSPPPSRDSLRTRILMWFVSNPENRSPAPFTAKGVNHNTIIKLLEGFCSSTLMLSPEHNPSAGARPF
jgi:hypothetical protein